MRTDKICRDTLEALCKAEDVHRLSDIPVNLQNHLLECKQCDSYRKSLTETIDLYKKYDIKLDKDVRKKLLCNTCEKLKSEI
jgi:hypothetical protein